MLVLQCQHLSVDKAIVHVCCEQAEAEQVLARETVLVTESL